MKTIIQAALIVIVILSGAFAAHGREVVTDSRRHRLVYTLEFINTLRRPVKLSVRAPLPQSEPPQQSVLSIDSSNCPPDFRKSPSVALSCRCPREGRQTLCSFTCVLQNARRVVDVDASSVNGRQAIPPYIQSFLKHTTLFPCGDEKVRSRALQVVGYEKNPYYRVVRLYDYVRSFTFQMNSSPLQTEVALESQTVQCSDASSALVTLCRSLGIPARYCAGVFMFPDDTSTGDCHAWCEAYIEPLGWLPLDPTMGRFDEGARLSRLAELSGEYVLLWRDSPDGFLAGFEEPAGLSVSGKDFRVTFSYRPETASKGSSWARDFPTFTLSPSMPPEASALLISQRPQVNELVSQGAAFIRQERYVDAEAALRKAIELDPGLWIAHRQLVEAAFNPDNASFF